MPKDDAAFTINLRAVYSASDPGRPDPIEPYALPDPLMTPGAADPRVDLSEICNGTTKRRRPPSTKLCDQVFAAYSIPPGDRYQYEATTTFRSRSAA